MVLAMSMPSRSCMALRKGVRECAEEEIRPTSKRAARESRPPLDVIRKAAEIGLLGVPIPRAYGGLGAGETGYCILMEELSRVDTSIATIIGAHIGLGEMSIYLGGNQHIRETYLPDLCAGKKIA